MKYKAFFVTSFIVSLCISISSAFAQNDDTWWENFNKNKQLEQKETEIETMQRVTELDNKTKCFQAPSDVALTIGYDRELYRFSEAEDPYRLNGIRIAGTFRHRFNNAPFIGLEFPIYYRFNFMNNSHTVGFEKVKKFEWGAGIGFLVTTGYKFTKDFSIAIAIGPKLDFTIFDIQNATTNDGVKYHNNYVSGDGYAKYNGETYDQEDLKQTKIFKLPLSMGITLKYKNMGLSFYYDRCLTNTSKNSLDDLYRDHLTTSLNIYFNAK